MKLDRLELGEVYSSRELAGIINSLRDSYKIFMVYNPLSGKEEREIKEVTDKLRLLSGKKNKGKFTSLEIELQGSKKDLKENEFPYFWFACRFDQGDYRVVSIMKSVHNQKHIERNIDLKIAFGQF